MEFQSTELEQIQAYPEVEAYHRWAASLKALGRDCDAMAVYSIAVSRGVWQHPLQRPNDLYVPGFWMANLLAVFTFLHAASASPSMAFHQTSLGLLMRCSNHCNQ